VKVLLISLALLAAAGFIWLKFFSGIYYPAINKRIRTVVIIVKDQEPWVEGLIRKIFCLIKSAPWVRVQVVDDGSCDKTLEILRCLQRRYPFELLSVEDGKAGTIIKSNGGRNKFSNTLQFDVRGLTGKDLLRSPLFFRLSVTGAGKFNALSK